MNNTPTCLFITGFCGDMSNRTVHMGELPCHVTEATDSRVKCTTSGPTKTVTVDNNGRHPEFGLGYAWSKTDIHITVGDSVKVR